MREDCRRSAAYGVTRRVLLGNAALSAGLWSGAVPSLAQAQSATVSNATSEKTNAMFVYVGAFTTAQRKARGDGINVYRMDPQSGAWTHLQRVEDLPNPSFLAFDRTRHFLYAVHGDLDEISAFAIDRQSGNLRALNRQPTGGKNGVHLAIDPANRFFVLANYSSGSVAVVPINADGSLAPMTDLVPLPGNTGPHKVEQASSHPHQVVFDPAGRFIFVPDKGLDKIFSFRLDGGTGKLAPNDPPFVETREAAGPRHMDFHPNGRFAYAINELDSTVATYRYDATRGALEPLQVISTLPGNFTGNDRSSEIWVAPSGRFVYGSNRGHDSIAILAVDQASGTLSPVGWTLTQGRGPRFFGFDPSARFLYAANEVTDTVVPFRTDAETGQLNATGEIVKVGSPACILFAPAG
jgi:6-phosphogluconolactonase (cycloisomerase 2 family)